MILAVLQVKAVDRAEGGEKTAVPPSLQSPHEVPGLIAVEVFADVGNSTVIYLATRWSDEESFRAWRIAEGNRNGFVLVADRIAPTEEPLENELLQANREVAALTAELHRSNEDLQQFAYIASHDLIEPLRTISGFAQLLKKRYRGKLDSDADEFIDYCVSGTQRLHALIGDLLTYSRVGRNDGQREVLNLNEIVEEVSKMLRPNIEAARAEIVHDDLPAVLMNRFQAVQLFENILTNAIKFRSEKPPRVRISSEASPEYWTIAVQDNGVGFEPEYAERIFEPFQRLHAKTYTRGSGIGLALCRKIVARYGGRIWAASIPGQGTRISFTLARGQVSQEQGA